MDGSGLIVGLGIGVTSGVRGGTMSIELSQIGTCRHWPELQSNVQRQAAFAGVAASANAINSIPRIMVSPWLSLPIQQSFRRSFLHGRIDVDENGTGTA